MNTYDYVVVGSGIAGLYLALLARKWGSVLILTKGSIDECNTKYAQGGIAAAIGKNDSPELHFKDTIEAGAGLCDAEAVRILVQEAPDRIADLIHFGVPFDTLDGEIALTKEAAHSVPRILHAGGDATGEHIELTLSRRARLAQITILENCLVTDIVVEKGAVQGVKALDYGSGTLLEFQCRFLILATGGSGRLFKYTTNPEIATGDGVALAYKAGAEITDMEFLQFHPTVLRLPGVPLFLISEAVRGEGGVLRNVKGEPFMSNYSANGDLAARDIVARGILAEMQKTKSDRVYLDVTHLPPQLVTARFPHIYRFCLDHGLDITKSLVPVAPASHYMMGGVKTNVWGETNITGLFAAGETACTGVHGANRLASNSLLEVVVFAKRILQRTEEMLAGKAFSASVPSPVAYPLEERKALRGVSFPSLTSLQSLMWERAGIVREGKSLRGAAALFATWEKTLPKPQDRPTHELANLILLGRLVVEAALLREESRGAHFRSDFPKSSSAWERRIVFRKGAS